MYCRFLSLALAILLETNVVSAETRLALVIGNADYQHVDPLENSQSDANLIAASLEQAGFEVRLLIDGNLEEMGESISEFGDDLRDADDDATGLFYFAGHGVQSFGENYLLPVDISLNDAADLGIVAVETDSIIRQMRSARNRTNIIIIDACRNNPFGDVSDIDDNGLAEMDAPSGSFIAMATAPGSVALDGTGQNSPFSEALAQQILVPGQAIEEAFKNVRVSVVDRTGGLQTPWDTSSLLSDFSFVREEPPAVGEVAHQQVWQATQASGDPLQILVFLQNYPDSIYAGEARALLDQLLDAATNPEPDRSGTETRDAEVEDNSDPCEGLDLGECYNLGIQVEFGDGQVPDLERASLIYSHACMGGHTGSCVALGLLLQNHSSSADDLGRALELFSEACAANSAQGCGSLAFTYGNAIGVSRNDQTALHYFQKSCQLGDGFGCQGVGYHLENGLGADVNVEAALQHYQLACDRDQEYSCDRAAELLR